MIVNPDKFQSILLGNFEKDNSNYQLDIDNNMIETTNYVELLGIKRYNELKFNDHISELCSKASMQLNAISRLKNYIGQKELEIVINSFIYSNFNYCPLVWMFCLRASNNKINKIHERALRVCQNDYVSTFENLLYNTNSLDIHSKIQKLMIEIYKCLNHFSPPIMKNFFTIRENCYNLRNFRDLESGSVKTVNCGLNTILYRGPQLWQQVPEYIKNSENLNLFKSRLKSWQNFDCPCNTCKTYIKGLGYM